MKKYNIKSFTKLQNCELEPIGNGFHGIYILSGRGIYEMIGYIKTKDLLELVNIKNKLTYQNLKFKKLKFR